MFLNRVPFILFLFIYSSFALAANTNIEKNYVPKNIKPLITYKTTQGKNKSIDDNHLYGLVSGGYGNFEDVLSNDGQTGILRLAMGTKFNINPLLLLGAEVGVQTGNRMRINSDNAIVAIGSAPVFLTIKPPIDTLLTVTSRFEESALAVQTKVGAAYCQGMVESLTIPNKFQVLPEIQFGLSLNFSQNISLIAYYQRIFGNKPSLTHINISNGTAKLNNLNTMQASFVGIERRF